MADSHRLRRAIRLPQATAMVVGTIIGTAIFVQPSEVTGQVPTVAGVFTVWLVCGVLTLFGALVCAELSSIFTRSGGVYVYLKEAYSPAVGFLWGWAMFWTMHSGIIAAIATVCGRYTAYFVELDDNGIKAVGIAMIVLLSAVNYVGVRQGSQLQTLFTVGKIIAIAAIIGLGFWFGGGAHERVLEAGAVALEASAAAGSDAAGTDTVGVTEFLLALVAGLFAFGGWHMVTYNSEETVEPRTTVPRALIIGTAIVTVCYVAMNAVYMWVLPLETIAASTRVAADAADAVWGSGGGSMMSALVIFSAFGALAGIILAGPRVYYAMAQDGLLFRWVGAVHPKFHTPHRAIVLQGIWSCVLVATGSYRVLFTRVIYTEWIFFGLMALGLIILRRRDAAHATGNPDDDDADRPFKADYRVWGYPAVPLIFAFSAFAIVINQVISRPVESATGLSLVLIGLPVYYLWARNPSPPAAEDGSLEAPHASASAESDTAGPTQPPRIPEQE